MKPKFKLKKDLPGFPAGTLFDIDIKLNCLYTFAPAPQNSYIISTWPSSSLRNSMVQFLFDLVEEIEEWIEEVEN